MTRVFLGLGSNIGEKQKNILRALRLISEFFSIKKKSHLYLTEPVGNTKQDWFVNCAIEIETNIPPHKLLSLLKSLEKKLGRTKMEKNGPRTIDIDILFYDDLRVKTKTLTIPHPHIQERLFVLQPLMDIDPYFQHPVLKKSVQELYRGRPWSEKVVLFK